MDSIWLSGMGSERTRIVDTLRPLPWRLSRELEGLSITISQVKEAMRRMPYISEEPRFIRERYILVAAIVIVIVLVA